MTTTAKPSPAQAAAIAYFHDGTPSSVRHNQASYTACRREGWIREIEVFPFHAATDAGIRAIDREAPVHLHTGFAVDGQATCGEQITDTTQTTTDVTEATCRTCRVAYRTAEQPVTTRCSDLSCRDRAVKVVTWTPPGSQCGNAFCQKHVDERIHLVASYSPQTVPVAEGAYALIADGDGTQVGICRHCGHNIYLYFAVAGREGNWWREGRFDETGRCGNGEQRTGTVVHHEPVLTVAEFDAALGATACGRTHPHPMSDCREARMPTDTGGMAADAERGQLIILAEEASGLTPQPTDAMQAMQRLVDDEATARAAYEQACAAARTAVAARNAAGRALLDATIARRRAGERAAVEAVAATGPIAAEWAQAQTGPEPVGEFADDIDPDAERARCVYDGRPIARRKGRENWVHADERGGRSCYRDAILGDRRAATPAEVTAEVIAVVDEPVPAVPVTHIRSIGAHRHNLCPVLGGQATYPGAATCETCVRVYVEAEYPGDTALDYATRLAKAAELLLKAWEAAGQVLCDYGYPLGGMVERIDWCRLPAGHEGGHVSTEEPKRSYGNAGLVRRSRVVPESGPDSVEQAAQWVAASGIPVYPYEAVRAWLDGLGVPVPVGVHHLMAEIRRAVIAAGDAGYQAGRDSLAAELEQTQVALVDSRRLSATYANEAGALKAALEHRRAEAAGPVPAT
ncbi:hypothetical protein [Micromonospora sp. WMMD737]|uniref:hypothetical protein n=1 Tax=Micromonospora sp. WMMD737 TaxID=3404113 RepID=UPI003B958E43